MKCKKCKKELTLIEELRFNGYCTYCENHLLEWLMEEARDEEIEND